MNKQLIARMLVKGAVGLVVSAGIGYAIQREKAHGLKIYEYFAKATDVTTN